MSSVRWNIAVSTNTDQSVACTLLAKVAVARVTSSRFIEEAVRAHILALSAEQAKTASANVNEDCLTAIVAEAVQWAREH